MRKMVNIIGLDLSLNHTGIAVFKNGNFEKSLVIEPNLGKKKEILQGAARLSAIMENIELLVEQFKPEIVVIEDISFGSRGKAAISIGELHGVVKFYFYKNNIPVVLVPPKTLKKWVTGSGNADKNLMLLKAYKRWGIEFNNDNECDAFCLGKYYLETLAKKSEYESV